MVVEIIDDFDLEKIVYSGQCFRPRALKDGSYLFISADKYLVIRQIDGTHYDVSCDKKTWDGVWQIYFDLGLDYSKIRHNVDKADEFMKASVNEGEGIRVLRQDRWEMIISYIISQRKSIPSIRTAVEKICKLYGDVIGFVEDSNVYSFPTPDKMVDATYEELSACGLGYRVSYILDAVRRVTSGELDLDNLNTLSDEELFDSLKEVKGIGDKVANCVMLFAYHRTGRAPVDTWILKVMNEKYNGINPFIQYGDVAGIMQQYVFFYVQNRKGLS